MSDVTGEPGVGTLSYDTPVVADARPWAGPLSVAMGVGALAIDGLLITGWGARNAGCLIICLAPALGVAGLSWGAMAMKRSRRGWGFAGVIASLAGLGAFVSEVMYFFTHLQMC